MSIPGAASPLFLATAAGGAAGAFEISRSLRFNSADSAYLNRTPSSAGNRRTWTWSCWIKRNNLDSAQNIFVGSDNPTKNNTTHSAFYFHPNNKIYFGGWNSPYIITDAVYRDPSAWYHIVLSVDTGQSTSADRIKVYVNNVLQSYSTGAGFPGQNTDLGINQAHPHYIGGNDPQSGYASHMYAEINFIDGSALDPTSFGQADANGVWQAIDTAGLTFGTNGFRLKFADNSGSTATTLGKDTSGNSNNWTPNNLSAGVVSNPTAKQNFDVVTYSGNSTARNIGGLAFTPDLVIVKARNASYYHYWVDSVRGTNKNLYSNSTEATQTADRLSSFNSDGFGLTNHTGVNNSGINYVAWCWKAGGAASSNTSGTITSSVSANTSHGFSICTYTGTGSAASIGHSLNAVPALIILKDRSSAYNWQVYHKSFAGTSNGIVLNSTAAIDTGSGSVWNSTTPTSTVFSIGNSVGVNTSGNNYVAYVWSEVAGFSKFGTFTHSGSASSVTGLGFKPRFVLIRRTNGTDNWYIFDSARNTNDTFFPNTNGAENAGWAVTFNNDGFSWVGGSFNSGDFIYAAYAATVDESAVNDCFVDTPTNAATPTDTGVGNEVVGNYATLNPLSKSSQTNIVLANGNLEASNTSSSGQGRVHGTIAMSSGKWYFEATVTGSSNFHEIGIIKTTEALTYGIGLFAGGYAYIQTGKKFNNNGDANYGASYTTGDIIGVAFDADNGTLAFYKNGASQGTAFTGLSGTYYPAVSTYSSGANFGWTANFGQRAFVHAAPTNFKSLNTANLPTPTIADSSKYFDTKLYTGNGGTQTISGYGFSPDWLWLKSRSGADNHAIQDAVRGATYVLQSNTTNAEVNASNTVGSFTSDGFTLAGNAGSTNGNNVTYAGWAWDAGTSTVTNNDGSIASQVRAQPSAGFSIVSWSGTGSNATVGHGLNDKPGLVLVKNRSATASWAVWSTPLSGSQFLALNTLNAPQSSSAYWNSTEPTSSVINVGTDSSANGSSNNMIAYCFASVLAFSSIGTYSGNGSDDGPFVYTGFKPRLIITRAYSSNSNNNSHWLMYDTLSDSNPYNEADTVLYANISNPLNTHSSMGIDILSNGFKLKADPSGYSNYNGWDYLYYAVAENPFQANGGLAR